MMGAPRRSDADRNHCCECVLEGDHTETRKSSDGMYSYLKFRSKAEVRGAGTHANRFVLYIFEADIFLTS